MKTPGSGTVISNPAFYLLQALISYWGTTDNDGNVGGTTIRCGDLALEPSYGNHALKILSGPSAGQTIDITTHPAGTDTITVIAAFTNVTGAAQQILAGTRFVVLSKTPAIAEIAALTALVVALTGDVWGLHEPTESLIETWQDLLIDPNIWTVTDPAGAAWNPSVVGAFLYIVTTPNANDFARLVGNHLWQLHSITPNLNLIVKKTIIEFSMVIGVPANLDNTLTLFGWTPDVGNTRASDNIIGFALVGDVLQTLTDLGSAETVNTGFGEDLTLHNKFRIEVYEGNVDFYLNEVLIATHVTNIPNVPSYPNFCIDTDGDGACAISIGTVKIWYEMVER